MDHKSALAARIANLREGMIPQLHNGYVLIGRLSEPLKREIVDELIDAVADGGSRHIDSLSDRLSVTEDEAGAVLIAVAAVAGALLDIDASASDFLDVAKKFYQDEDKATVFYIAERVVEKRPDLKSRSDKFRLSTKVIPSFSSLYYTVDVRLEFKGAVVSQTAPVALVNILTDVSDEKLCMQINEHQLDILIADLETMKSQLLVASSLSIG